MKSPNFEGSRISEEQHRHDYISAEKVPSRDFLDPEKAITGFGRLFNRVVKDVSERLPI
jgi:hypothetical protein